MYILLKEDESKEKEEDWVEVEFKMWDSCKIKKKEFFFQREKQNRNATKRTCTQRWKEVRTLFR